MDLQLIQGVYERDKVLSMSLPEAPKGSFDLLSCYRIADAPGTRVLQGLRSDSPLHWVRLAFATELQGKN